METQLTSGSLLPSAHSGSAVCSDCSTDTAYHPQPVPRDSGQPGTASSQELRQHDREYSPHHPYSGTADGSHTLSGGSLYPSNHDRILPSLKNKAASADGNGVYCVRGTSVAAGSPLVTVRRLSCLFLFFFLNRRFLLDFSKVT